MGDKEDWGVPFPDAKCPFCRQPLEIVLEEGYTTIKEGKETVRYIWKYGFRVEASILGQEPEIPEIPEKGTQSSIFEKGKHISD